jgi:hypothetical protein
MSAGSAGARPVAPRRTAGPCRSKPKAKNVTRLGDGWPLRPAVGTHSNKLLITQKQASSQRQRNGCNRMLTKPGEEPAPAPFLFKSNLFSSEPRSKRLYNTKISGAL